MQLLTREIRSGVCNADLWNMQEKSHLKLTHMHGL